MNKQPPQRPSAILEGGVTSSLILQGGLGLVHRKQFAFLVSRVPCSSYSCVFSSAVLKYKNSGVDSGERGAPCCAEGWNGLLPAVVGGDGRFYEGEGIGVCLAWPWWSVGEFSWNASSGHR